MFSIVVYGQLILEQAGIRNLDQDILNQIFDFMVRDFASFALQIYGMNTTKDGSKGLLQGDHADQVGGGRRISIAGSGRNMYFLLTVNIR